MSTSSNSKKKYTYIWVSTIIFVFGIIVVPSIVDRLLKGEVVEHDRLAGIQANGLAFIEQNGAKRSMPSFVLIDQDSSQFDSSRLRGKVVVLDFFFSTCPTICPVMSKNMAKLQDELAGEEVAFVSISINPRYDTPSVLRQYAKRYGANPGWHFLTGEAEAIYKLSSTGFYMYAKEDQEAPGGFEHSGLFALVDQNGFIRSRKDEYGNPLIYYRGSIAEEKGSNEEGETEQIGILREDIRALLKEGTN
jgi:protein SCO1/2